MIVPYISRAIMSLALLSASVPASGQAVSDALLDQAAPCKNGMQNIGHVGTVRHLDTFPGSAYHTLSNGRQFPIRHAGESRSGMLFVTLDLRHRIIAAYTKYYTWGRISLKKTTSIITDLANTDLSHVATVSGIRIGSAATMLARLPGPKTTWICGGAQQNLYVSNCDSTQFSVMDGRVVAIESSYGGC